MSIVIDQDPQAAAIKAALNAAMSSLNGAPKALDYDEAPTGSQYVRVDISRRFIPGGRIGGIAVTGGRLTVRYVAGNVFNARAMRKATTSALEERTLTTADGSELGPFVFEVEDPIEQDDAGYWTGADTFIF